MKYKRICSWCLQEYETDDIELDHCSHECFIAEEIDLANQPDDEKA